MIARLALLFAILCLAAPAANAGPAKPLPGLSVYNLSSKWTTQDGQAVALESLRGRPMVVAMIYLSCPDVCPLIAENMQQIEAALPKPLAGKIGFALFSFDGARDTPDKLKLYGKARGLDFKRWTLFRSDESAARDLAAALDVTFRKREDGEFDHSIVIALLDADGVVVYRQIGLQKDTRPFIARITSIAK